MIDSSDQSAPERRPEVPEPAFERELALCRRLSQEYGGRCNWGVCDQCGVIPLLHKLHLGRLVEDQEELWRLKQQLLSD